MSRPPFELPPEERVVELAGCGLTQEQIAYALGIAPSTLYKYKAANTEFAEWIKRGQAQGIQAVASKLWESAVGGDTTSQIFYLKCRAGWRDRDDVRLVSAEDIAKVLRDTVRAADDDDDGLNGDTDDSHCDDLDQLAGDDSSHSVANESTQ